MTYMFSYAFSDLHEKYYLYDVEINAMNTF